MKTFTLKTMIGKAALLVLFAMLSTSIRSQCSSSFNYSIGANGVVNFSSTSTSPGPMAFQIWKFDDSTFNAGPNISYTFQNPGTHTVTLYTGDSISCWSSVTDTLMLPQFCLTNVSFSMIKDTIQVGNAAWFAIPAYSPNVVGATWSWGDGSTTNGLFPTHTYSAPGVYMVCVTVTASCGGTDTYCLQSNIYRQTESSAIASISVIDQHNTTTGIRQYASGIGNVAVYPNPSSDKAALSLVSDSRNTYKLEVFSVAGKLVMTDVIMAEPGTTTKDLNVSTLGSGLYLISISNGSEHKTLRFIKE